MIVANFVGERAGQGKFVLQLVDCLVSQLGMTNA
jgi:hypothetical protein